MKTLPVALDDFGFVNREERGGKPVGNRCGRDFLYYALHYEFPNKFNPSGITPEKIEKEEMLGMRLPSWLMWTQLQFLYLPKFLKEKQVKLFINKKPINSFLDFVSANLFSRVTYENALSEVEKGVDVGKGVGIDISLGFGGLLDHVVFVYGYDEENLYICDTHQVPKLEYEKVVGREGFLMKLPKEVIKKRWTRFGRFWEVVKI